MTKAVVGTAVQAGCVAVCAPISVVGPLVGFVVGVGASMVTDAIIDRYWDDPIGQVSKDLQSVGKTVGNVANNIVNAITSVIPPLSKLGWW